MSLLEASEVEELCERSLIMDEEGTALDFDAVLATDVVGIALDFEGDGYISTIMEVISNENDVITGKDAYTEEEVSFSFEEASVARSMGYFEILYRKDADGKDIPFGVDNELKVQVMVREEEDPGLGVPQDPNAAAPVGLPENIGDIAAASQNPDVLRELIEVAKSEEDEKCGNDCSTCTTCK
jgi:hypothetical protein